MPVVTLRGLRGLGALTAGQRDQARRQFMQRVRSFDNYDPTPAEEHAYYALADRVSAHLNAIRHLQSKLSLHNWGIVGDHIMADVNSWLSGRTPPAPPPLALPPSPPGQVVVGPDTGTVLGPATLITGRARGANRSPWPYVVAGVGVLSLGALLVWNIARRRRA